MTHTTLDQARLSPRNHRFGALVVSLPALTVSLTGCVGEMFESPEQTVVRELMTKLSERKIDVIAELGADSLVPAEALGPEMYARKLERPKNITYGSPYEHDGQTLVTAS